MPRVVMMHLQSMQRDDDATAEENGEEDAYEEAW